MLTDYIIENSFRDIYGFQINNFITFCSFYDRSQIIFIFVCRVVCTYSSLWTDTQLVELAWFHWWCSNALLSGGVMELISCATISKKWLEQHHSSGGEFAGNTFKDIHDFKKILLKDKRQIARNIVERLITQATGAVPTFTDRVTIEKLLDASEKDNLSR